MPSFIGVHCAVNIIELQKEPNVEGKFTFWIISDDLNISYLKRSLHRPKFSPQVIEHVDRHLEWKQIGTNLRECYDIEGSPDAFLVDAGCLTTNNPNDREYVLFKKFAMKHSSALFCIVSFVQSHMHTVFQELHDYVKDEIVVEQWGNGNELLADYMVKKVLLYYPLEG